jgi:hypothetical protein
MGDSVAAGRRPNKEIEPRMTRITQMKIWKFPFSHSLFPIRVIRVIRGSIGRGMRRSAPSRSISDDLDLDRQDMIDHVGAAIGVAFQGLDAPA